MTLSIGMYSFETTDAAALAGFWSEVTSKPVDPGATPEYATLDFNVGPTWMFVKVAEPATGKNRFILDLTADPYDDEVRRIRAIAGVTFDGSHEDQGVRWSVFRDPDGNTFRLFAPRPS